MIRWIKKGILRLSDREVGPGGEFPESVLPPERIAEFIARGWAERIRAKSEVSELPVEQPLLVNIVAPALKAEPKLVKPEKPSKTKELNERQETEKPRRRGRPRKARG